MLTEDIKQQIQQIYGQEIKYPIDCEGLAACVSETTGNRISSSTLKRLFGFVKTSSNPSQFTLDTIALYFGYPDWVSFEKSFKQEKRVEETENIQLKEKELTTRKKDQFILIEGIILTIISIWFTWYS